MNCVLPSQFEMDQQKLDLLFEELLEALEREEISVRIILPGVNQQRPA